MSLLLIYCCQYHFPPNLESILYIYPVGHRVGHRFTLGWTFLKLGWTLIYFTVGHRPLFDIKLELIYSHNIPNKFSLHNMIDYYNMYQVKGQKLYNYMMMPSLAAPAGDSCYGVQPTDRGRLDTRCGTVLLQSQLRIKLLRQQQIGDGRYD